MNFQLFSNSHPEEDYSEIKKEMLRESLRQVRQSYNLALVITGISASIALAGVGLLYFDKVSAATLTTSTGLLGGFGSIQFANQKKEELRQMMNDLEE
ncbi:TRADD-N-associated membrane domain-containing protein [Limnofasciculus baicalensis]|uniref:Cyanobacterial TRADD-N associated 2 transmembrane domain-containing protein n=1 Tax=Limnofasciculus baicalensis BBK-W-15 TaxID=2699891 RepID=A0AAE3GXB6_9CYAN|nr:hypothetical protein [Limnofasciculus baicalensis]MCP2731526.1 hypothetical protein [Limnofasciculus baicalensis BBK-W-15]